MIRCFVSGCSGVCTPMGRLCSHHKARKRRHGEPTQETISTTTLKPYRRLVEACIRRNPDSPCWPQLDALWESLMVRCTEELRERKGKAGIFVWDGLQKLAGLHDKIPPRDAWVTIAAVYALAEFEPRRFRSKDGFRFQLVRRLLSLTDVNTGTYWNHELRRMKRVYRDLRPRVTHVIADYVVETFGGASLQIAVHEKDRIQSTATAVRSITEGLARLDQYSSKRMTSGS